MTTPTHLLPLYTRLPISFVRGEGVWLFDAAGTPYFDTISGLGVTALGHAHPQVIDAIVSQAHRLLHVSNGVTIPEQERLAALLCELSGMDKAFFCNSGAEANEAAIKLARLYGHQKNIPDPSIVVLDGAFHGRTLATLSANSGRKTQIGFEPLVTGFERAPFNEITPLKQLTEKQQDIVAVLIEPIQGSGGIRPLSIDYLQELRRLCDERGWLLIIDEVQSGIGRTGAFYAYQHASILADIVTSAKALANGIPIGACLTRGIVNDLFHEGQHGTTFGGNPFACSVAERVLSVLKEEQIIAKVDQQGAVLLAALKHMALSFPFITEVRGKGFMLGIEFSHPLIIPGKGIRQLGLEHGLLLNVTAQKVLRLMPPLVMTLDEQNTLLERLEQFFTSIHL